MEIIKKYKWIFLALGVISLFLFAHNSLYKLLGDWIFFLFPFIISFCIFLTLAKGKLKEILSFEFEEIDTAKVIGIPLISALVCFLLLGLFVILSDNDKLEKDGVITDGVIIEITLSVRKSTYRDYTAIVEFKTEDGVLHRESAPIDYDKYIMNKNAHVKVKYLPEEPQSLKIILDESEKSNETTPPLVNPLPITK